jgi:CIC family chloride channel protein
VSTALVAVVVAMVFNRLVAAARWVVDWPRDADVWWSAVVVAGAVMSMLITQRSRSDGSTAGAFLRDLDDPPADLRSAPARFAASITGVGLGTPLGLDGPALQLGGSLGAAAARLTRRRERPCLVAGGVAALSMAVSSPLAAMLLVVELAPRRTARRGDLVPLALGGAAGWTVRRLTGEPGGLVGPAPNLPAATVVPSALVLGALCGIAGGVFAPALARRRPVRRPLAGRTALVALTLGAALVASWIATGQPILLGAGERSFEWARGSSGLPVIAAAATGAVVVAVLIAADVTGGLVLPVHWLGGMAGIALAHTWLPTASPSFAAVAGGSALLAATCAVPGASIALGFAAFGWSAAAWAVVVAVIAARLTTTGRWRPLVCS